MEENITQTVTMTSPHTKSNWPRTLLLILLLATLLGAGALTFVVVSNKQYLNTPVNDVPVASPESGTTTNPFEDTAQVNPFDSEPNDENPFDQFASEEETDTGVYQNPF